MRLRTPNQPMTSASTITGTPARTMRPDSSNAIRTRTEARNASVTISVHGRAGQPVARGGSARRARPCGQNSRWQIMIMPQVARMPIAAKFSTISNASAGHDVVEADAEHADAAVSRMPP